MADKAKETPTPPADCPQAPGACFGGQCQSVVEHGPLSQGHRLRPAKLRHPCGLRDSSLSFYIARRAKDTLFRLTQCRERFQRKTLPPTDIVSGWGGPFAGPPMVGRSKIHSREIFPAHASMAVNQAQFLSHTICQDAPPWEIGTLFFFFFHDPGLQVTSPKYQNYAVQ